MSAKPAVAVVVIGCGLAVAACGASSSTKRTGSSPDSGIAFADCMRSHGVPNFPDPSSGGGIQIPVGSGMNPASPSFKAARSACAKLLPLAGAPPNGAAAAQQRAEWLTMAQCMRAHGVSGFPDPTSSPPGDPSRYAFAIGRPGAFIAVPKTINVNSPAFKQAASTCRFGLPGRPRTQAAG